MTLRDIVIVLFKWKYSLLFHFAVIVGSVAALVYLLPQTYEAEARLLIESNMSPIMRSNVAFGAEQLLVLNSETEIIRSHTVLSRALDEVGLPPGDEAPPSVLGQGIAAAFAWLQETGLQESMTAKQALLRKLKRKLDIEPVADSNVIGISFAGRDPRWITQIINTVIDVYIDHHLKVYSPAGSSDIFERQLARLDNDLKRQRARLAAYKDRADVAALEDTMSSLVYRQGELSDRLTEVSREIGNLSIRFSENHPDVKVAVTEKRELEDALEVSRQRLTELEQHSAAIEQLTLNIARLETSHVEYQRRYEEERLTAQADKYLVNVRVIEYAHQPLRPVHSRIFFILLGVLAGGLTALSIAVVREFFDHRIEDEAVVANILGVPTLGSIRQY